MKVHNIEHQEGIVAACGKIMPQTIHTVLLDWQKHLWVCVGVNGRHTEHIL
jgi:hypothetical protein